MTLFLSVSFQGQPRSTGASRLGIAVVSNAAPSAILGSGTLGMLKAYKVRSFSGSVSGNSQSTTQPTFS